MRRSVPCALWILVLASNVLAAPKKAEAELPPVPKNLLKRLWKDLTPGEVRQATLARELFERLLREKRPLDSPPWKRLLRNSMAELACLEAMPETLESRKDALRIAALLRFLGALDLEANAVFLASVALRPPLPPSETPGYPGYFAGLDAEREGYLEITRRAARDALLELDIPTPKEFLEALAATPRELKRTRMALSLVRLHPDEAGLLALVNAVDSGEFEAEGAPPRAPVKSDYPEGLTLGITRTTGARNGIPGSGKEVVTREEFRRAFEEATGLRPPGKGKALAWWNENREAALAAAEKRLGDLRMSKPWRRASD